MPHEDTSQHLTAMFCEDKNFKRHFRLAAPAVRPRRRPLLARGDSGSPSTRRPHAAGDCSKAWRGNARPGHAAEDA
ncbi:MAG: hypothetical protein ACRERE_08330 [Candidatus Entotheonellia bacterium]